MARPSTKTERTEEILDAAMRCVAQHGISGLTLSKVSDVAGIARPLIRHNVGNRDELIKALTEHFLKVSTDQFDQLVKNTSQETPLSSALEYLFDSKYSNTTLMLVAEALIAESANDETIQHKMRNWLIDFVAQIEELARLEFPASSISERSIVASGITGIYFTVDSLAPIKGLHTFAQNSKEAAMALCQSLQP